VDRLKRIIDDPDFPVRVNQLYLPLLDRDRPADDAAQWVIEQGRQSTGKLRMGIVKYFLDGSIQGFTARLKEPGYLNQQPNGIWLTPPEEMAETLLAYHKHGLTMHCHCNGDEAVDVFLDAVERVQAEAYWPGLRHTIHHSQLTTAAQYQRMADLGICANIFANHIYYWGDQHAKLTVGPDRAQRMDACRTAGNMGVHYSLHSDAPITPINQLHSVWAAVNRLTASGNVMGENERISVYEALHAVTLDTAYTLKMDHEVGSIEPGKLADFTVLEENPFDVDPMKIRDIPIWGTVMGGRRFPAAR
jgi:predicted amidohydrolase YtcJ